MPRAKRTAQRSIAIRTQKMRLRGLMNAYVAQKSVDQAISAANAQIAKSPNNSGFYDLLGTALFHNKKDLAGAAAAFEKATELDKNNSDARLKLAQVQAAKGSTEEAIATCRRALRIIQTNPVSTSCWATCIKQSEIGIARLRPIRRPSP